MCSIRSLTATYLCPLHSSHYVGWLGMYCSPLHCTYLYYYMHNPCTDYFHLFKILSSEELTSSVYISSSCVPSYGRNPIGTCLPSFGGVISIVFNVPIIFYWNHVDSVCSMQFYAWILCCKIFHRSNLYWAPDDSTVVSIYNNTTYMLDWIRSASLVIHW